MRVPRLNYKTSDMYSSLFIHLCIDKENTHGSLTVSLARLLANPVHTSAFKTESSLVWSHFTLTLM